MDKSQLEFHRHLMLDIWSPSIADSPLEFVRYVFPWGKKGGPLENFKGPKEWQIEVLKDIEEHIKKNKDAFKTGMPLSVLKEAVSSGRGIGKSSLVSWIILWFMSTRIGGTVIVSANSEAQLKSVTWGELSKWHSLMLNKEWFEISATKLVPKAWFASLIENQLQKGTRYYYAEGKLWSEETPDNYAGAHSQDGMIVIFDEASGIPQPIWDVAAGYFTDNTIHRYWFAFSNPRNPDGAFFECFNSKKDFWKTKQIDARNVEGTDKEVYRQIIQEWGEDSRQAKIEVYGHFPSIGDNQFIDAHCIDSAMNRAKYNDNDSHVVIGVDVARFGDDKTCIAVRQGRDLIELKKFSGIDTMETVGWVIRTIEKYRNRLALVNIDEGGLGAGVVDRLKEQRYKVRGVNFGHKASNKTYLNKRSEMWGEMKDWLKTASLDKDHELKKELIGPTYKPNSTGAIQLERKEDMKRRGLASPDGADAIALTFAFPIPKILNEHRIPEDIFDEIEQQYFTKKSHWMAH